MDEVDTDVLIVGAGPTGLALAIGLQQAGVAHRIVDELAEGQNSSRAGVIHAHTLEALGSLGVVAELQAQGMMLSRLAVRDRDRALIEINFDRLPSAFKGILMIPQSRTEAILAARLEELGGRVERGLKAVRVSQWRDVAEAYLQGSTGEERVRARFIVGADGMHSMVRAATGIRFEGRACAGSFVLADVRMDWPHAAEEVSLYFSESGLLVVAPMPDGSYRLVATMEKVPANITADDIQLLLDVRGPTGARPRVQKLIWGSRFRVHHRLASSYRDGKIMVMGDAAHVHSPAGGQGMNTGLVDASVLGQALALVIGSGAPLSILDRYVERRRPAPAQVLGLASRMTRLATMQSPIARTTRNLILRILNRIPRFKAALALQLSGLSRRGLATLPAQ